MYDSAKQFNPCSLAIELGSEVWPKLDEDSKKYMWRLLAVAGKKCGFLTLEGKSIKKFGDDFLIDVSVIHKGKKFTKKRQRSGEPKLSLQQQKENELEALIQKYLELYPGFEEKKNDEEPEEPPKKRVRRTRNNNSLTLRLNVLISNYKQCDAKLKTYYSNKIKFSNSVYL
jgi:hypothetical protein